MSGPEILEWMLRCPLLKGASSMVADLHALKMMRVQDHLPRAISAAVSERVWLTGARVRSPEHFERFARMYAARRTPTRLTIHNGTALVRASLAPGIGVVETIGRAVVHLRTMFPDTVEHSLIDKPLGRVIASPLFQAREYRIVSAAQSDRGLTLWIATPIEAIPLSQML